MACYSQAINLILPSGEERIYQIELMNYLYLDSNGDTRFLYGADTKTTETVQNSLDQIVASSNFAIYKAEYLNGATGTVDPIGFNFDYISRIYERPDGTALVRMEDLGYQITTTTLYSDIAAALIVANNDSGNQILVSTDNTLSINPDDSLNYTINSNIPIISDSILANPNFVTGVASAILCENGFVDTLDQKHVSVDEIIIVEEYGGVIALAVNASCEISPTDYTYRINFPFLIDTLTSSQEFIDSLLANPNFSTSADIAQLRDSVRLNLDSLVAHNDRLVALENQLLDDADADPNNEIQALSKAGSTISLSLGGGSANDNNTQLNEAEVDAFVANNGYLTAEVDGDSSNEIQNITWNPGVGGNDQISLDKGGGTITINDDNTQLNEGEVDAFVANNGYLTSETDGDATNEIQNLDEVLTEGNDAGNNKIVNLTDPTNPQDATTKNYVDSNDDVDDADPNPTNEIQDLSVSGDILSLTDDATPVDLGFLRDGTGSDNQTLSIDGSDNLLISNGNSVSLTPYLDDTQLNENEVDAFVANNGYLTSESDPIFSASDAFDITQADKDDWDNDLVDDADSDPNNEMQTLSKAGSTISLSLGGGSVTDDNTQLNEAEVDAFVSDNGYLTTEVDGSTTNEIQDLSISGNILSLTGDPTTVDLSSLSLPNGLFTASNNGGSVLVDSISSADFKWNISNPAEWRINKTNTTSDINSLVFTNSTMTFFVNEGEANEAGIFLGSADGIIGVKTPESILENATNKILTGVGWNPSNKRTQVDFVKPNNLQVNNPANSNVEEGLFATLQDIYNSGLDNTDAQIIGGSYDSGTKDLTISLTNSLPVTIPLDDLAGGGVTTEEIQDVIGAMLSGNTETGITVTYQDTDGTIDFVVTSGGSTDTSVNGIDYVSGRLRIINGACHWISAKGNPQGVYDAPKGSLFTDSDGYIYFKKSDGVNGWKAIAISL